MRLSIAILPWEGSAKLAAVPFSLTGQPNAMGGREVGGLANMLAAHMNFSELERDRVGRFWKAPNLVQSEGLKAVSMFDAIAKGDIKALWVIGSNPAVSLPDSTYVKEALSKLDLLIVSDVVNETDTMRHAHVKPPGSRLGREGRHRDQLRAAHFAATRVQSTCGKARPDWRIISDVATAMGYGDAFGYPNVASIFREHASLSAFENGGERVFDLSGITGHQRRRICADVSSPMARQDRRRDVAGLSGWPFFRLQPVRRASFQLVKPPTAKYRPTNGRLFSIQAEFATSGTP